MAAIGFTLTAVGLLLYILLHAPQTDDDDLWA